MFPTISLKFSVRFLFVLLAFEFCVPQKSSEWLCADENCSKPIGLASASKNYLHADSKSKITVRKGDKVEIIRKPKLPDENFLWVKSVVTGKEGLLHKTFLTYRKALVKETDLVPASLSIDDTEPKVDIKPSAPAQVFDGTTIYDNYEQPRYMNEPTGVDESMKAEATIPSAVQSTAPPSDVSTEPTFLNSSSSDLDKADSEKEGVQNGLSESNEKVTSPVSVGEELGISSTPASTMSSPTTTPIADGLQGQNVVPSTETANEQQLPVISASSSEQKSDFIGAGLDNKKPSTENEVDSSNEKVEDLKSEEINNEPNVLGFMSSFLNFANGDAGDEIPTDQAASTNQVEEKTTVATKEDNDSINQDDAAAEVNTTTSNEAKETHDPLKKEESDYIDDVTIENDSGEVVDDAVKTPESDPRQSLPSFPEQKPTVDGSELQNSSQTSLPTTVNLDEPQLNVSSNSDPLANPEQEFSITQDQQEPPVESQSESSYVEHKVTSSVSSSSSKPSVIPEHSKDSEKVSKDPTGEKTSMSAVQEGSSVSSDSKNDSVISGESSEKPSLTPSLYVPPISTYPGLGRPPLQYQPVNVDESASESRQSISPPSAMPPITPEDRPTGRVGRKISDLEKPEETADTSFSVTSGIDNKDKGNVSLESATVVNDSKDLGSDLISEPQNAKTESETGDLKESSSFDTQQAVPQELETLEKIESEPIAVTSSPPGDSIGSLSPNDSNLGANIGDMIANTVEAIGVQETPPSSPFTESLPSQSSEDYLVTVPTPQSSLSENKDEAMDLPAESWYTGLLNWFNSPEPILPPVSSPPVDKLIPEYHTNEEATKREEQDRLIFDEAKCDSTKVVDDGIDYLYGMSPRHVFITLLITLAVLAFSLGFYYLENHRRDVELVKKYNDLAGKLFIEQKEKEMLAQQLTVANESMTQISFDTSRYDEEISQLKSLAEKLKGEKTAAEGKEKETMKKYVIVEKNYNELKKILSQNKQKGERTALIADIQNLKDSITANNIEIASLKEQLSEKKDEIKALNARAAEYLENRKELEKTLENTISANHETAQKYQESISNLEKNIEESTAARVKLEKDCMQLKKEKETLAIEKEILESSLQKYQRLQPSQSLSEWLDVKEVRVSLLAAEKRIEELNDERDSLIREKDTLTEKLRVLQNDLEQLNENYEKAEKEKVEAFTRLQVLSDYFKEKETQLQEELGTREALWVQRQSDDKTIYEQMRALREENASFKKQTEALKHEILEQEASFKKLITSAEDKAHENWVALRHNERRLKETQMEAAQLRARLTALEAPDNPDDKMNKGLEMNGDGGTGVVTSAPVFGSATSPPFMLYHPQPGEFVPPPPLLPHPPSPSSRPSRPPPLGRISSPPPLVGDFTPPPPLVPYDMFLQPSASPPPPHPIHVLHKPQPLMDGMHHHRTQKDSQSSNHSSESTPDKLRRNKR